jgi:hypothetical protein
MIYQASQNIKFQFTNKNISSNGGIFLYADFLNCIDLKERLRKYIPFKNYSWIRHEPAAVIVQKVLSIIAGYEDNNDASDLKHDPVYRKILDDNLASQPTLSRIENAARQETVQGFYDLNLELLHQKWQKEGKTKIILDPDSTDCVIHGNQIGSAYHGYYQNTIYHPLLIHEAGGDLIKAVLRQGNCYTAHKIIKILMPMVEQLLKWGYAITLRGDSGMGNPHLYEQCEDWGVEYYIRLKKNAILANKAQELLPLASFDKRINLTRYASFQYAADSWNKERTVHIKQIYHPDQLLPDYYFVVTSDSQMTAEEVFDFYEDRGTAENFIKEGKLDCGFTRLSCSNFWANAFRLQIATLAYNIHNCFRELILPDQLKPHYLSTIRSKLIKVGCRIIYHSRQIICQFGKSFKIKKLFEQILINLKTFSLSLSDP